MLNRSSCSACGRPHLPALGRFHLPEATPQQPPSWWKHQQQAGSSGAVQPGPHSHHAQRSNPGPNLPPGIPAGSSSVKAVAQRQLLQQPNTTAASSNSSAPASTAASTNHSNSSSQVIRFCPAWADEAATAGGVMQLGNGSSAANVTFSADFNQAEHGGATAAGRQAAIAAAAAAATRAAGASLLPPGNSSNATEPPQVMFAPGLFDPLTMDEMLAVYAFLFSQPALNLTPIEAADNNDNFVAWLQLQPPNKQQASAWLEQQDQLAAAASGGNSSSVPPPPLLPQPPRTALAMLIQGRQHPPRVAQIAVGPLPQPSNWSYVPLSAQVDTAGWLQRPYSGPEANRVALLINSAAAPLVPVIKQAFDGWYYDPGSTCGSRCLVYSLGAPFGAGPAAAGGTRVGPGSADGKRWLWIFFYRNLEGHHLHTVGLELQLDVSTEDPAGWAAGQAWLGGSLWPSPQALAAAWNSSRANSSSANSSSSNSSAPGADTAALELLRSFHLPSPDPKDALFSTFVPRGADGTPTAAAAAGGVSPASPPRPPLQYEPDGRRFRLSASGLGLEGWMGWSLALGHSPTAGLSFWDVRFRGERLLWELSLQ
eukprot:jgi/Sobl393_1/17703/SZX72720.1